jgi:hypothetical protein
MTDRRRRVDVDHDQRLLEGRGAGDDLALLVDDERVTVEDELVLAADGVHERDPGDVVAGADAEHLLALPPFAEMERRGRDVGDDVCASEREVGGRRARLPDVLADRGADECLAKGEEDEFLPGLEVPVLVENAVVRKEALVVDSFNLAVGEHGAAVEEVAIEVGGAEQCGDARRLCGDQGEAPLCCLEEAGPQQQVFRRIARDRELGQEYEVGLRVARALDPGEDSLPVPVEVADDRVHLREGKAHEASDGG